MNEERRELEEQERGVEQQIDEHQVLDSAIRKAIAAFAEFEAAILQVRSLYRCTAAVSGNRCDYVSGHSDAHRFTWVDDTNSEVPF